MEKERKQLFPLKSNGNSMSINSLRDGEKMDMQEQNSAGKWMQFEKRCKSKKKKKNSWNEIVCSNLQLAVYEQGNIRCKELAKDILNNTLQNILLENPQ